MKRNLRKILLNHVDWRRTSTIQEISLLYSKDAAEAKYPADPAHFGLPHDNGQTLRNIFELLGNELLPAEVTEELGQLRRDDYQITRFGDLIDTLHYRLHEILHAYMWKCIREAYDATYGSRQSMRLDQTVRTFPIQISRLQFTVNLLDLLTESFPKLEEKDPVIPEAVIPDLFSGPYFSDMTNLLLSRVIKRRGL